MAPTSRPRRSRTPAPETEAAPAPEPAPEPEPEPEPEQPRCRRRERRRAQPAGLRADRAGRYDEAIPLLQRAVASFPPGTSDLNYAYALFNLGKALRLPGRPKEAIPYLEKRLRSPTRRRVVRRELERAQQAAGG